MKIRLRSPVRFPQKQARNRPSVWSGNISLLRCFLHIGLLLINFLKSMPSQLSDQRFHKNRQNHVDDQFPLKQRNFYYEGIRQLSAKRQKTIDDVCEYDIFGCDCIFNMRKTKFPFYVRLSGNVRFFALLQDMRATICHMSTVGHECSQFMLCS